MNHIDQVKRRLDKLRNAEAGQIPSAKQMAVAAEYGAALFARMNELRNAIKAHARVAA